MIKSVREAFFVEAFFVSVVNFHQQIFLATSYLSPFHLSIQILASKIYSFKPSRYTFECNNLYKM